MSVTYPTGFRAAGVTAGLKASGLADLGLLVGDPGTTAAALFTTNSVAAAPVQVGRDRVTRGHVRAVLVNSGQANAATGPRGIADAVATSASAASLVGVEADEMLPCSTGVIGEPLHVEPMTAAMPGLVHALSTESGGAFARSILTTDTVHKQASAEAGAFRVGGCAKGVGMIAPNLATMLAFVTTDAAVTRDDLHELASERLAPRFNALTIDGCTSTNDTVLLMASGSASAGGSVAPGSDGWSQLVSATDAVGDSLVSQLIADGEGVTHVMIVDVEGAASDDDARRTAKAVADSPLVKTAVFGGDPNPGRFLQAAGAAGVALDPTALDVSIGGVVVATGGVIPPAFFEPASWLADDARAAMKEAEIHVLVRLGTGPGSSRVYGCDLSYEYVRINGEYTT